MSKIFISYARKDKEEVYPIVDMLESNGLDCWIDKNGIESGSEFEEIILDAIDSSEVFLHMLSENSKTSNYVKEEYKYATAQEKRIVTVLLHGAKDNPRVMFGFNTKDFIDIYDNDQKEKLLRDLKKWAVQDNSSSAMNHNTGKDGNTSPSGKKLTKEMVDSLPQLHITTLGQKGHGKSLLTTAILNTLNTKGICSNNITYKDLNNPGVSKYSSGHSVHMAHVPCNTLKHRYQLIDCSSHDDYDTLLSNGLHEFDGAILVVDAKEGPMPETREHIILAAQADIARIIVYISNCDAEDDDPIDLVEMECREILSENGFDGDNTPVIRGSSLGALSGESKWTMKIEDLLSAVDEWITPHMRAIDRPFKLEDIDDVCYKERKGTLVHGRISSGIIKVGDIVTIPNTYPRLNSSVDAIQLFGKFFDQAEEGDLVHLLLPDIGVKEMDQIKRGMFLRKNLDKNA